MATHTCHLTKRTGSLLNTDYGEDLDRELDHQRKYEQKYHESLSLLGSIQEEYIDQGSCLGNQGWSPFVEDETKTLNRKGITVLSDLYKNNQKFKDEIIDFIRDKTELSVDQILDKRFKYKSLNNLGRANLKECVHSRDYTRSLIKIIASHEYLYKQLKLL